MSDLKLLAFVPNLEDGIRNASWGREHKFPYFRQGYVDLGLGREVEVTDSIRDATEGFAIADARGVVQAKYKTAQRAQEAMEAARPRFIADLDLDPDEDPELEAEMAEVAEATSGKRS